MKIRIGNKARRKAADSVVVGYLLPEWVNWAQAIRRGDPYTLPKP